MHVMILDLHIIVCARLNTNGAAKTLKTEVA